MQATRTETWLPVVGFEGRYEVSDIGRVRSVDIRVRSGRGRTRLARGRVLSVFLGDRYPTVSLKVDRRQHNSYIHRLVAAAFIGPCPPGLEVCHNNGDKTDNRVENLRYDTHSSNALDMTRHGLNWNALKTHCKSGHEFTPENTRRRREGGRACRTCARLRKRVKNPIGRRKGEANHKAKLTEQQVRELRAVHAVGHTTWAQLGRTYGISGSSARAVALGLAWSHVA